MMTFRDMPIKRKLTIIIMATTAAALLLAGVGIMLSDTLLFRQYLRRDLTSLAGIVGDNSTAAISFDDAKVGSETLAALRARPHIVNACIYEADGKLLARYARANSNAGCVPGGGRDELRFGGAGVAISRAILLDGKRIGTLTMLYDLAEVSERFQLYGGSVLGVLLISILIAFLLSSVLQAFIANPISRLVGATTSVAETNDYSIRAEKLSDDELGVLVDRFNEMLEGIQSRDQSLRTALRDREAALREAEKARERFRFMAESMPQKIFTATPAGDIDYYNQQWSEFTGLTFEQIKDWAWTQFVHPDDVEGSLQTWRHSLESGEPFHFQARFRRADGEYRWHLSRAQAMRGERGNISMWIGSSTEIHEQKEKEEELRRANEDLQQFAYSASHDLQEPIRNVAVYSEVVAQRYAGVLDEDGKQFLGFLTEGGRRLATLINDLLAYTRAGQAPDNLTSVDAGVILEQTLANLAEAIRESGAVVTHDALPRLFIGEAHLQQLFQNLIGNAIKYRGGNSPQVHISAARQGGGWRVSVRDNGIGIDSRYKEKIFGVFKRLHRDETYSGTGIGLAICQRVVERYGGRIWVESTPGEGSTFTFSLPEQSARERAAAGQSAFG